jgi:DNA invertase Pin-like site-specific DNA recombinase
MNDLTILYIRVSSETQNLDRQIENLSAWAKKTGSKNIQVVTEKISGSVSTEKRKFNEVFTTKNVSRVVVQDIDRLGRDTIDILTTIKKLTAKNINLTVTSLGMDTLLPNGKENESFKLVLSVMATLAEMERTKIKARQKQGIAIAKKKGKYAGRKTGAVQNDSKALEKHNDIVKLLSKKTKNYSLREISSLTSKSVNTVRKIKNILA